jgi:hypothetical protein
MLWCEKAVYALDPEMELAREPRMPSLPLSGG